MKSKAVLVLGILALILSACSPPKLTALRPAARPNQASDEAGYWLQAQAFEASVEAAPTREADPALEAYVREVACKTAGAYCQDLRVYVVRKAGLNAAMLPNGTMIIQTGALLRLADEAQLAALIGHELGHYVERHTFAKQTVSRKTGDLTAWLGLAALSLGTPEVLLDLFMSQVASVSAYSRTQELAADRFGLRRLVLAGYDPLAAPEIWRQVVEETGRKKGARADHLLATHPSPDRRFEALAKQAEAFATPEVQRHRAAYQRAIAPHRREWLADELRNTSPSQTLRLARTLANRDGLDADLAFIWGEAYRLRAHKGDAARALRTYAHAAALPNPRPEIYRSIGLVRRGMGRNHAADAAFRQYLALAPSAEDQAIVRSYLTSGG